MPFHPPNALWIDDTPIDIRRVTGATPILSFPGRRCWGADLPGGFLQLEQVTGLFYDFYLVNTTLEADQVVALKGGGGICLCFSIKEYLHVFYGKKTHITLRERSFNLLPVKDCRLLLQNGCSGYVFILLPDYVLPNLGFHYPYITGTKQMGGTRQEEPLLTWPKVSCNNEEIYQILLTLLSGQYPDSQTGDLFAALVYEIITQSIHHLFGTCLLPGKSLSLGI